MKNMLALLGALVIGFGVLGWYLGWYKLSVTHTTDGNISVRTDVDAKKVGEAIKNVGSAISHQAEKVGEDAKAGPQPTPATTPSPAKSEDKGVYLFGIDLTPKK